MSGILRRSPVGHLLLGALSVAVGGYLYAGQTSTLPQSNAVGGRPTTKQHAKTAPTPELPVPFHVGERLDYRVAWATFSNAASIQLAAPEKRDLFGWHTWHFQAAVHTVNPVRTLFAIDDQFDSYTDSSSLESRQYENYLDELGKKESEVLHLIPTGEKPRAPGSAVVVLPGTRDPLGMLYALRVAEWQKSPEMRAPVYDGNNVYELRANLETTADRVNVDAGTFKAQRIAIRLFQNGTENSAIHFTLWLANDAARTPVQIAAELPFGSLRVELTSASLQHAELR